MKLIFVLITTFSSPNHSLRSLFTIYLILHLCFSILSCFKLPVLLIWCFMNGFWVKFPLKNWKGSNIIENFGQWDVFILANLTTISHYRREELILFKPPWLLFDFLWELVLIWSHSHNALKLCKNNLQCVDPKYMIRNKWINKITWIGLRVIKKKNTNYP